LTHSIVMRGIDPRIHYLLRIYAKWTDLLVKILCVILGAEGTNAIFALVLAGTVLFAGVAVAPARLRGRIRPASKPSQSREVAEVAKAPMARAPRTA